MKRLGRATFKIRVTKKRAVVVNREKLAQVQQLRTMGEPLSIPDEPDRPRGRGRRRGSPPQPRAQEAATSTNPIPSQDEQE